MSSHATSCFAIIDNVDLILIALHSLAKRDNAVVTKPARHNLPMSKYPGGFRRQSESVQEDGLDDEVNYVCGALEDRMFGRARGCRLDGITSVGWRGHVIVSLSGRR